MALVTAGLLVALLWTAWIGMVKQAQLLQWFAEQQQEWFLERRELLTRIKPETAPRIPGEQTVPQVRHFDLENDAEYQKIMGSSKEELAELVEAGEL